MTLATEELACVYAAAILADDDIPVTADKITTIMKAAGVSIEGIWPSLFARALQNVSVRELISNAVGQGGSAPSASGTTGAEQAAAAETTDSKPAQPATQDEDSESDEDMGFGLFD